MLNHKRIMSLVLAGAMAVSMAVPAFAATTTDDGEGSATNRSLKIDGTYQAVDIAVVVPSSRTITINPYALPVQIGSDGDGKAIKIENQQIVTQPTAIKNQSDIKLDVNVTATATVKGSLTLLTAPSTDYTKETKNTAFLYLDAETTSLSGEKEADDVNAAAIAKAWKEATWTDYTAENTPTNVVAMTKSGTAASGKAVVTLAASTMSEDDGTFSTYNEGSIAFINVRGGCAQNPTTAWTTKDGVTVQVAFTFTPNTET